VTTGTKRRKRPTAQHETDLGSSVLTDNTHSLNSIGASTFRSKPPVPRFDSRMGTWVARAGATLDKVSVAAGRSTRASSPGSTQGMLRVSGQARSAALSAGAGSDLDSKASQYQDMVASSQRTSLGPLAVFQAQVQHAHTQQLSLQSSVAPPAERGTGTHTADGLKHGSGGGKLGRARKPLRVLLRAVAPLVTLVLFNRWKPGCAQQRNNHCKDTDMAESAEPDPPLEAGGNSAAPDAITDKGDRPGYMKVMQAVGQRTRLWAGKHRDWCTVGVAGAASAVLA
jgi:hypothetical protein